MEPNLVLALLLSLPVYGGDVDEDPAQHRARFQVLAGAIAKATDASTCAQEPKDCKPVWRGSPRRLAALLTAIAYRESGFARFVHDGSCNSDPKLRKRWCDSGRAASVWQIQTSRRVTIEQWRKMLGTSEAATTLAATTAARLLGTGVTRCGHVKGSIALYATGSRCVWKGAEKRRDFATRLHARLLQLEQKAAKR